MRIRKPDLYRYSPHKGSMLLIDEVYEYSLESPKRRLDSIVRITPRSMFFDKESNCVPSWISFEYMAQNLAILSGIRSVQMKSDPNIGFIIGIREFESKIEGFRPGDSVQVMVKELYNVDSLGVYDCTASGNGTEWVHAVINAVEANDEIITKMEGA